MEGWDVAETEGVKVADTNLFEGWKVADTFFEGWKVADTFFRGVESCRQNL